MLAVGRSSRQWNRSTYEHCTCTLHGPDGCRWCSPISKVHTPQPRCAHIFLKCTPISKGHSTLHTPDTPCASCCLIVSRWLLMSSRAMLLLVLIAHSGQCVWNKYAGHPPKWKRFPSWVAPGLLWSIQHCNISLGQDPVWQIIVPQGLCSEHTCIETYWNATCWDIQAVLLLFAVPDGAVYDSLTINCGKCH